MSERMKYCKNTPGGWEIETLTTIIRLLYRLGAKLFFYFGNGKSPSFCTAEFMLLSLQKLLIFNLSPGYVRNIKLKGINSDHVEKILDM